LIAGHSPADVTGQGAASADGQSSTNVERTAGTVIAHFALNRKGGNADQ